MRVTSDKTEVIIDSAPRLVIISENVACVVN